MWNCCTLWVLLFWVQLQGIFAAPFTDSLSEGFTVAKPRWKHQPGGEEHIVIVSSTAPHVPDVLKRIDLTPEHADVSRIFNNSAFRGFSARMHTHCINKLRNMGDILHIEKTALTTSFSQDIARQNYATWGLQRISSSTAPFGNPKSISYTYSYAENSTLGRNVDIYIVDTGIYTENSLFGGRARMGWSYESDMSDQDGHGTHVSGTAAGYIVGVASGANLIGVKVLGADGTGSTSEVLAGMDWVINTHDSRKTAPSPDPYDSFAGSVMSMSWGLGSVSPAIQTAVHASLDHGVHISMAAGNSNTNACGSSPAAAGGANSAAVSVGSIGSTSQISSFSNTGPCVDIYAPGENVLSSWIGGENMLYYLNGTSMATPHVTGIMAYFLAADTTGTLRENPAALKKKILEEAFRGVVQGNGDTIDGDRKLLLNNGIKVGVGGQGATLTGGGTFGKRRLQHRKTASLAERQLISAREKAVKQFWGGKMPLAKKRNGARTLRY